MDLDRGRLPGRQRFPRGLAIYSTARWHAEGLRWIGTLFLGAADYLERPGIDDTPCEPLPPQLARSDDYLDEVRSRIHSRYF